MEMGGARAPSERPRCVHRSSSRPAMMGWCSSLSIAMLSGFLSCFSRQDNDSNGSMLGLDTIKGLFSNAAHAVCRLVGRPEMAEVRPPKAMRSALSSARRPHQPQPSPDDDGIGGGRGALVPRPEAGPRRTSEPILSDRAPPLPSRRRGNRHVSFTNATGEVSVEVVHVRRESKRAMAHAELQIRAVHRLSFFEYGAAEMVDCLTDGFARRVVATHEAFASCTTRSKRER